MIVGVLLAAGRGSRFAAAGRKQLALMPDGQTMLAVSVRNMCAALDEVVMVVRDDPTLIDHAKKIAEECDCRVVVNARADEGMATSIACGVEAARDADGWLIGLADMPRILLSTHAAVARALEKNRGIVVPVYQQQRGHPVGFDRAFMDELQQLAGDSGARELLRRHADRITLVEIDDAGILLDIDTPADMPA